MRKREGGEKKEGEEGGRRGKGRRGREEREGGEGGRRGREEREGGEGGSIVASSLQFWWSLPHYTVLMGITSCSTDGHYLIMQY